MTGGSSGIGFGIATALGRAGARVVIAARGEDALRDSVERLQQKASTRRISLPTSRIRASVDRLCAQEPAHVDVLVNCAGVNIRPPMGELTDADWETTIAVNQTAPYLLGSTSDRRWPQRGWGRIINVGSQQSVRAFGNSGAYGVAKAAVTGLSRSQSEAWAALGVCSNTIIPGFVVTADDLADDRRAGPRGGARGPHDDRTQRQSRRTSPRRRCSWPRLVLPTSPDTRCSSTADSRCTEPCVRVSRAPSSGLVEPETERMAGRVKAHPHVVLWLVVGEARTN